MKLKHKTQFTVAESGQGGFGEGVYLHPVDDNTAAIRLINGSDNVKEG